jgi:hypothetical protein
MRELRGAIRALRGEMLRLHGELRGEIAGHVRTIFYANAALAVSVGGLVPAAAKFG